MIDARNEHDRAVIENIAHACIRRYLGNVALGLAVVALVTTGTAYFAYTELGMTLWESVIGGLIIAALVLSALNEVRLIPGQIELADAIYGPPGNVWRYRLWVFKRYMEPLVAMVFAVLLLGIGLVWLAGYFEPLMDYLEQHMAWISAMRG